MGNPPSGKFKGTNKHNGAPISNSGQQNHSKARSPQKSSSGSSFGGSRIPSSPGPSLGGMLFGHGGKKKKK